MSEQILVIKNRRVNTPHVLSSGVYEATITGSSDSLATEQLLTPIPIGIRHPRGAIRVLLQLEYRYGSILSSGKGCITLRTRMIGNTSFEIYALHDLPNSVSKLITIHWFAVGYEDYEDTSTVTVPVSEDDSGGSIVTYPKKENFSGITDTLSLEHEPIDNATLMVWADRVPMFNGDDFTVSGGVVTFSPALDGTEAVTVIYTWTPTV